MILGSAYVLQFNAVVKKSNLGLLAEVFSQYFTLVYNYSTERLCGRINCMNLSSLEKVGVLYEFLYVN